VRPVVAEVEDVGELLAWAQPGQLDVLVVLGYLPLDLPVRVRVAKPGLAGEGELLQVGSVPAGERVVDGVGELFEGVTAGGGEDPSGPGQRCSPWPSIKSTWIDSQVRATSHSFSTVWSGPPCHTSAWPWTVREP
jgi:hypothetical protein